MLSKSEIGKLPVEQQEIFAQLELSQARRREKLLEQARGLDWRSRYFPFFYFTAYTIVFILDFFNVLHLKQNPVVLFLVFCVISVIALHFNNLSVNRRLDALMKLLDFDRQNQTDSGNSKDNKA